MRKRIEIMGLFIFLLAMSSSASGSLMTYDDFPDDTSRPVEAYTKLIERFWGAGPLIRAKRIDMGKTNGTLLFLEYEFKETIPPARSISAYCEIQPGKYKLVVPRVPLYYGRFRMYEDINYHVLFLDTDGNGEVEIFLFSDEARGNDLEPGFYLNTVYVYDKKLGIYLACSPGPTPEKRFDPKDFSSGIFGGCSYGPVDLDVYVDTR